jgi:aspartyl-tRNA(Asn)/glutamyl-tRNA(Gln) amidotransferase subunit A
MRQPQGAIPAPAKEKEHTVEAVDVSTLTVARAATLIHDRDVSPVELTQAYLERIEQLNPRLNAYITVTAERAMDDARRADEEIAAGQYRGPLHGVPVALKDIVDTAGIRTTGGAKIFADRVPSADATVVRKLREAGSVLLGKLNTHELAGGVTTNNPHFGPTRNPWNPAYIPGGSSGGSGAAVAAGLATATLGTDTAGSVRIPAALCGVVGLMPTYGRVSKAGVLPLSWQFDHVGPLTHTVEDAALVLQVLAGYDAADFSTVPMPIGDYATPLNGDIRGLRVGVPRGFFYERLDDEVRAAVEAALEVLGSQGATIQEVAWPSAVAMLPAGGSIFLAEIKVIHAEPLRERPGDLGADLAGWSEDAGDAVAMAAALRACYTGTEEVRRVLEAVDVLVTPTTPVPAVPIGEGVVTYGGTTEPLLGALVRCTAPFNGTHLPGLSVPCGFTAAGLPLGLQIAGRPFDEVTVLRVGHAYEQATTWHTRRPEDLG